MSFADQISSFFDELSKIEERKKGKREEVYGGGNRERPFSSLLTQDEEPANDPINKYEEVEPEVVTRR